MKAIVTLAMAMAAAAVMPEAAAAQQAGSSDQRPTAETPAPGLQMRVSKNLPRTKQAVTQQKQRLAQATEASARRRAVAAARKEESR